MVHIRSLFLPICANRKSCYGQDQYKTQIFPKSVGGKDPSRQGITFNPRQTSERNDIDCRVGRWSVAEPGFEKILIDLYFVAAASIPLHGLYRVFEKHLVSAPVSSGGQDTQGSGRL
jgi:hypothetical protein